MAFLLPGSPHGLHTLALERCESPETTGIRTLADKLGLSRRRAQALYWVAQGKSNGETAGILGISIHTVNNHLKAVYAQLSAENRHAATVIARDVLRKSREFS